ncbi:MAG: hypothetical protein IJ583_14600, partial [Firmicutes bacterium]|nr:hypothetical protein [Bacillota bacterium]
PYSDTYFENNKNESVQEFRFQLSKSIKEQVFIATFVAFVESTNKSESALNLLKEQIFSKSA